MVRDLMTSDPACCAPDETIETVAQMMIDCDCGEIPVCDESGWPIGVVTDRDIVCRVVAQGRNPIGMAVSECMSRDVVTVTPDSSIDDAARLMETHRIRRLPVVDEDGMICGMLSQADLATRGERSKAARVVERVSESELRV